VVRGGADGSWTTHVWEGRVTALAFVGDGGALVAATYFEVDDTTALVLLDESPSGGGGEPRVSVVARIGPAHAEASYAEASEPGEIGDTVEVEAAAHGRVLALAYDDARGVVWVAGGFGVAAFAVP